MFKAAKSSIGALGAQKGINKTLTVPTDLEQFDFFGPARPPKKTSKEVKVPKRVKLEDAPKEKRRGRFKEATICGEPHVALPYGRCISSDADAGRKRCDEVSKQLLWEPDGVTRRIPIEKEIDDACVYLRGCSDSQKRGIMFKIHPDKNGSSPAASNAFQALMNCLGQVKRKIQRTA